MNDPSASASPVEGNRESASQLPPELAAQHAAMTAALSASAPALEAHLQRLLEEFGDVFEGDDLDTEAVHARISGLATRDPERHGRLAALDRDGRALLAAVHDHALSAARSARDQAAGRLLARLVPEWRDGATVGRELGEVRAYLEQQGFAPEAVAAVDDPYDLAMARKAMLYDRMLAKARERSAAPAPRPVSGSNLNALKARLAQSGRVEDAAAVIEQLLADSPDERS